MDGTLRYFCNTRPQTSGHSDLQGFSPSSTDRSGEPPACPLVSLSTSTDLAVPILVRWEDY